MDLQPIYRSAVRQFDSRVRLVRSEQWRSPTPASQWAVADLVRHVVEGQLDVPRLLAGDIPAANQRLEPDASSGLVEAWDFASTAAVAALAETDAETVVGRDGNELTIAEFGWRTATDLTVHAWDLARAINAQDEFPNDLIGHVLEHAKRDPGSWRRDERYAPAIPVPGCTDDLIELLALTGRNRWWRVGA
jgi:uncharacterized protein (TIGR03086 family)